MAVSPDRVQQILDTNYPKAMTPTGISIQVNGTVADVQVALNRLITLKRAVLVSDSGTASQYQGAIFVIKKQLDSIAPQSTTAANIASQLKLDPSTVQSDLDRLVILGQANKVVLQPSGVIQYASAS
jgi:hypothetical protein